MPTTNNTTTYRVKGMTCEHCVRAVQTEIGLIDGVQSVQVSLLNGTVTVDSTRPLPLSSITEAVDEAGYELQGQS